MNYDALNNLSLDELDKLISVASAKKQQLSFSVLEGDEFKSLYNKYKEFHSKIEVEKIDLDIKDFEIKIRMRSNLFFPDSIQVSYDYQGFELMLEQNPIISDKIKKINKEFEDIKNLIKTFSKQYNINFDEVNKKLHEKYANEDDDYS